MIKCSTSRYSSPNLFDYESGNVSLGELKVSSECQIIQKGTIIETKKINESITSQSANNIQKLINIKVHKRNYWIQKAAAMSVSNNKNLVWMSLRDYIGDHGMRGIRLHQGDVIRMGGCSFRVKEIVGDVATPHEIQSAAKDYRPEYSFSVYSIKDNNSKYRNADIQCRICLNNESTEENPIISSPCRCSGSIRYVHLKCLQKWLLDQVVERRNEYFHSYSWQMLKCDICKTQYPSNTLIYS